MDRKAYRKEKLKIKLLGEIAGFRQMLNDELKKLNEVQNLRRKNPTALNLPNALNIVNHIRVLKDDLRRTLTKFHQIL